MFIYYKWDKNYNSKSDDYANEPIELILRYELEAAFAIGYDENQMFSENFVPVYMLAKAFKESKFNDLEINLEGWGCNPFLTVIKQGSKVRVKNDFIDFECSQDDYESATEHFIKCIENDIHEMGFRV